MRVPTQVVPRPHVAGVTPRVSVNNFGFGGANAHAILERGPRTPATQSASASTAWPRLFKAQRAWLEQRDAPQADLSYTLLHRRTALPFMLRPRTAPRFSTRSTKGCRASRDILHELGATWDLEAGLLRDAAQSRVNEAELAQPATTAIQIAHVALLRATVTSKRFLMEICSWGGKRDTEKITGPRVLVWCIIGRDPMHWLIPSANILGRPLSSGSNFGSISESWLICSPVE